MRITPDGQITIPEHIRERYGLSPDAELVLEERPDGVFVRRVGPAAEPAPEPAPGSGTMSRGEAAVAALREAGRKYWIGGTTTEHMELTRGPFDDVAGHR